MKKIIFALPIILLLYFFYKGFLLFNYSSEQNKDLANLLKESGNTYNIEKRESNNEESFQKISYTIPTFFKLDEEKSVTEGFDIFNTYTLVKEDKIVSFLKIGKSKYNIYQVLVNEEKEAFEGKFRRINAERLLNKFSINNNREFIEYTIENYNKDLNIFTNANEIKMNYFLNTYAKTVLPTAKISFINGNITGHMFSIKNDKSTYYEVQFEYKDENYFIAFANSDEETFSIDDIIDFIAKLELK